MLVNLSGNHLLVFGYPPPVRQVTQNTAPEVFSEEELDVHSPVRAQHQLSSAVHLQLQKATVDHLHQQHTDLRAMDRIV